MTSSKQYVDKQIQKLSKKICNCKELEYVSALPTEGKLERLYYVEGVGFYYWDGSVWVETGGGGGTGLELLTEGANTGWRLVGRNPVNYGDIGNNAVDFSNSGNISTTRGATGENSMAWGARVTASGSYSTAWGYLTQSTGLRSTAWGYGSQATQQDTTAWGAYCYATVREATAWGSGSQASGRGSTAWGLNSQATTYRATAWGGATVASASYATAFGADTIASGAYATAWGKLTTASGYYATSWGQSNTANSRGATVFGNFATVGVGQNTASLVATDELFKIGNGTSTGARSDAFTIYKNAVQKLGGIDGATLEALTPQEGWVAFVNAGTGATINSVGIWSYQAGAWVKL